MGVHVGKRKPIPGRTIRVECPRCQHMAALNWRRSLRQPRTIQIWVHPRSLVTVEVCFVCPKCRYRVSLGADNRPYAAAQDG